MQKRNLRLRTHNLLSVFVDTDSSLFNAIKTLVNLAPTFINAFLVVSVLEGKCQRQDLGRFRKISIGITIKHRTC